MTCVVLDWDDTLLSSTYLKSVGYELMDDIKIDDELQKDLCNLENKITNLINGFVKNNCHILIVTNAETHWVEMSTWCFIPRIYHLLEKCKIISARSTYEHIYPKEPVKWKYHAIQDNIPDNTTTILSIGDSLVERNAVMAMKNDYTVKMVKMTTFPSLQQLIYQQTLIYNWIGYILAHKGHLDLMTSFSTRQ